MRSGHRHSCIQLSKPRNSKPPDGPPVCPLRYCLRTAVPGRAIGMACAGSIPYTASIFRTEATEEMKRLKSDTPLLKVNASTCSKENASPVRAANCVSTSSTNAPSFANGPSSFPRARTIYRNAISSLAASVCAPHRLMTCFSRQKLTKGGDNGLPQPSGSRLRLACANPCVMQIISRSGAPAGGSSKIMARCWLPFCAAKIPRRPLPGLTLENVSRLFMACRR